MSILALTSDTLTSPAAAGQIEYASPIFAATPIGTQRGIVPTQQYYRLDAAFTGTQTTSAQPIFNVGCTLSASTVYEFEMVVAISKSAGTVSHTFSIGFGGTATLNNIAYENALNYNTSAFFTGNNTSGANAYMNFVQTASASSLVSGLTSATVFLSAIYKGTVSINAGGTFIPQYTITASPGGAYTTTIGSYIKINPLSASGAATNVGTWA